MRTSRRRPLAHLVSLALTLAVCAACGKKDGDNTQTSAGTIGGTTNATTSAVRVADVTVGRGLGTDKRVSMETTDFRPADTVYASVHTTGTGSNTQITARWTFEDGQQVDERTESISPTGDAYTEFHVAKPSGWPAGKYTVHILINGQEATSKDFTVKK